MEQQYITLPRNILTDELWQDGNLSRLLLYLLSRADADGEILTDMAAIGRDLSLSRQTVRTLMAKIEKSGILSRASTTRTTRLTLGMTSSPPPPPKKRSTPRRKTVTEETPLSYVAEEFRETWEKFLRYRIEIKKPYKSEATARIAYNKMVSMADNDPEKARDMVERSILGQWQGLFKEKDNDNRTDRKKGSAPRTPEERVAGYQQLAGAVLRRVEARKDK